jgi:hypothetical protein
MHEADNISHSMHTAIGGSVGALGMAFLLSQRQSNADSHAEAAAAAAGGREAVLRKTLIAVRSERDAARAGLADSEIDMQGLRVQIAMLRADKVASAARETVLIKENKKLRDANQELGEMCDSWAALVKEIRE